MSLWKHLRALLMPFTVAVIVPLIITLSTRAINPGWGLPVPANLLPILIGISLIVSGLYLLIETVRLFIAIGRGTLAPWDPTQKLVVHGVYRHVRNPMISGVGCILLGEAVLLGSLPLFVWFSLFLIVNMIYIPLSEEPGLLERFGDDYRIYQRNVPRWIPRLRAWKMSDDT